MPLNDDIRDMIEHATSEAQDLLRGLTAALPRSTEAHLLLASAYMRRLQFNEALATYRSVLALEPANKEALYSIGLCHLLMGDFEAALAAYQHTFAVTSGAGALRVAGLLQHRLGRIPEAIATFERVLAGCQPSSGEIPIALQGLVAALRDAGRPLSADQQSRQLIDRARRDPLSVASELVARNSAEDFHEWSAYADKAHLGLALTRRLADDPGGRVPETFVLPQQRDELAAFAASPAAPTLYIVKPIRSSGGQGISVTADVATALDRQDVVVQRYIERPYLVDGRKGHCRVYGLITCVDPLRAYVYSDGIVRFAPEPYAISPDNPGGPSMHVTNTALHLDHPGLVISQDPAQEDVGAIWSLAALLRRITADGGDGTAVFAEIKGLAAWFVRMLAADGLFARQAAYPRRSFQPKLFGLDVLIDSEGHPWLIEMQRIPAARGAPLVDRINGAMFTNIFNMANGVLTNDAMSGEQLAALRGGSAGMLARELEMETGRRGGFVPLDLSPS